MVKITPTKVFVVGLAGVIIYRFNEIVGLIYDLTEPDWDELRRHRK